MKTTKKSAQIPVIDRRIRIVIALHKGFIANLEDLLTKQKRSSITNKKPLPLKIVKTFGNSILGREFMYNLREMRPTISEEELTQDFYREFAKLNERVLDVLIAKETGRVEIKNIENIVVPNIIPPRSLVNEGNNEETEGSETTSPTHREDLRFPLRETGEEEF
jgi:hypothetical protein